MGAWPSSGYAYARGRARYPEALRPRSGVGRALAKSSGPAVLTRCAWVDLKGPMRACVWKPSQVYQPWLDVSPDSNLSKPFFFSGALHTQPPRSRVHLWTHLAVTQRPPVMTPLARTNRRESIARVYGGVRRRWTGRCPPRGYSSPPADQLTRVYGTKNEKAAFSHKVRYRKCVSLWSNRQCGPRSPGPTAYPSAMA